MRWDVERTSDDIFLSKIIYCVLVLLVFGTACELVGASFGLLLAWLNLTIRFAQLHLKPHESYLSLLEARLLFLHLLATIITHLLKFRPFRSTDSHLTLCT